MPPAPPSPGGKNTSNQKDKNKYPANITGPTTTATDLRWPFTQHKATHRPACTANKPTALPRLTAIRFSIASIPTWHSALHTPPQTAVLQPCCKPTMPITYRTSPLIGRRLLALSYDLLPILALWLLVALLFTLAYTLSGHRLHENIAPFSPWQWLLWLCCWCTTGLYATVSWRYGGQTLGMRPWQLRVVATTGHTPPDWCRLWCRYAVASVSLATLGCGFWWGWLDPDGRTWHDRASRTRLERLPRHSPTQPLNDAAAGTTNTTRTTSPLEAINKKSGN